MGSENNMVAVPNLADEFEAWWATYRHCNRDFIGYNMKKFIAFEAFQAARLAQPDAQQEASSPASGEGVERLWGGCPKMHAAFMGSHDDATPLAAATQLAVPQEVIERLRFNIETQRVLIGKSAFGSLEREAASQAYLVMSDILAALTGAGENGEQGA